MNLFICETAAPEADPTMLIVVIGVILLMFVMNFLSQRKQRKQMQEMLANMDIGAKVKTIGGLIGTIVEINPDTLVLDIGTANASTIITIDRNCIYDVKPAETQSEAVVKEEVVEDTAQETKIDE